jgi:hypothetical protein
MDAIKQHDGKRIETQRDCILSKLKGESGWNGKCFKLESDEIIRFIIDIL